MPAYRFTLTMLSPVHIGSGEEIEPTDYVVEARDFNGATHHILRALDLAKLLGRLTEDQRRRFNEAVDQKALFHLRKFIRSVATSADYRWSAPCNKQIHRLYQAGLEGDSAQLLISLMTRDGGTGCPYVPGSSIKGALRTAWLSRQLGRMSRRPRPDDRNFEALALGYAAENAAGRPRGEIRADPFRAIRVGDAPLPPDGNIIEPVRIHKPGRKAGEADPAGIQMYYDVTFSRLDGEDITAEGRLIIDERLAQTPTRDISGWPFQNCVAGPIKARELLDACNDFYRPRLKDEFDRFPVLRETAGLLLEEATRLEPGQALIRLGRFSHKECVTVDPTGGMCRKPGTTRSLVVGELPLGWARLTLAPLRG